jgi:F-box protein 11
MPTEEPLVGFLSYLNRADKLAKGGITQLRERLEEELQLQLGLDFHIFQDRQNVAWGQNWRRRISEALGEVMFLFPVLTPGFFQSAECRKELRQFLEYEKQRGRDDLILPIHYVGVSELTEPATAERDELVEQLLARQIVDWRELRVEPHTNPVVGRALESMAKQVRAALRRGKPAKGSVTAVRTTAGSTPTTGASVSTAEEKTSATESPVPEERRRPATQNEPETLVVDAWGRKGSKSLGETIRRAPAGARILIHPGVYEEALVIDKPLEILGQGEHEDILIRVSGAHVIEFKTNMGRLVNLKLRQAGGESCSAVDITQGRLELEDCDISSESGPCVVIRDGADPRLRRNRIHGGKKSGVLIHTNGLGTLEDNDIWGNGCAGAELKEGGNPTLRRNRIHKNKYAALWIHSGGRGTIQDNDLRDNGRGAWDISSDCLKNVKRANNQE